MSFWSFLFGYGIGESDGQKQSLLKIRDEIDKELGVEKKKENNHFWSTTSDNSSTSTSSTTTTTTSW